MNETRTRKPDPSNSQRDAVIKTKPDIPDPKDGVKRVVVAMSGGVDSSVVAGLLAGSGHEVIGITLQLYDHGAATARKGACCAGQDVQDARDVAARLGIPHYVLDYEKRFKDAVIGSFAESYISGETPIPCVTCNQKIKFQDLLATARELGADALATGHYIQRRTGPSGATELYRARDTSRDQSYFLFATTPEQLSYLWFPLGGMVKSEVRDIARDMGLVVAEKSDSQDICFVPNGRYSDIIEKLKPGASRPGNIVHVDGRTLGQHDGIINYTVGQRRGLKIATGEPLFVVKVDAVRNEVVVGPRDVLHTQKLVLRNVNWLGDDSLDAAVSQGLDVYARIRSSQMPRPASLARDDDGSITVILRDGESGVAVGQACVLYADGSDEARVLGGGWIAATAKSAPTLAAPSNAARFTREDPGNGDLSSNAQAAAARPSERGIQIR